MDFAAILEKNINALQAKDHAFARDLIRKSRTSYLSEKQAFWLRKLANQSLGQDDRQLIKIGEFKDVIRLFGNASEHLKHPAVQLWCSDRIVRLTVASSRARYPGTINVADKAAFGEGRFYGRITQQGEFQVNRHEATPDGLVPLLKAFAANPEEVAAAYGKLTGHCCFCSRHLQDERSTDVGYGPVCAQRWGLAWGGRDAEA